MGIFHLFQLLYFRAHDALVLRPPLGGHHPCQIFTAYAIFASDNGSTNWSEDQEVLSDGYTSISRHMTCEIRHSAPSSGGHKACSYPYSPAAKWNFFSSLQKLSTRGFIMA